ncbi:MAG: hypothetical protein N2C14_14440, partial [Planctomycetales bacterium]
GNLGYWGSEDDHAVWTLDAARKGTYQVTLEYACDSSNAGNTVVLEAAGQRVEAKIESTKSWDAYRRVAVGEFNLPKGQVRLGIRSAGPIQGYLFDLKTVVLRPR